MREIKATALKKNDVIALRYNFAEKIESWDFGVVYKISESQLVLWTDFRFNQKYKGHLVAKPLYFSILFLDGRAKIFLIGEQLLSVS